jgi:hypothetical protein
MKQENAMNRSWKLGTGIILAALIILMDGITVSFSAPVNPQGNEQYNLSQGEKVSIPAKKAPLPLYVFGDESGGLSRYIASGYMGDTNALSLVSSIYDETAPASTGKTGKTSLKVQYLPKGREGWAGLYWLSPANNWGRIKGAGYDLKKAIKLTFWVRGERGGEKISEFKVGGVNGPYPDTDAAAIGPIRLTKDWKQYTIDLKGKDLRHIVGGFMFVVKRAENVRGATFYLDEIVFVGDGKKKADLAEQEKLDEARVDINKSMASAPEETLATASTESLNAAFPVVDQNSPLVEGMVRTSEAPSSKGTQMASAKKSSKSGKKKEIHVMKAPAFLPVPVARNESHLVHLLKITHPLLTPSAVRILESVLGGRSRGKSTYHLLRHLEHRYGRWALHWKFFPYVAYIGAR